jgi:hypothetical protein
MNLTVTPDWSVAAVASVFNAVKTCAFFVAWSM